MTEAPRHTVAAESQFASACLNDADFARDFAEVAVEGLSAVKALDWLAPFCRDYARKYGKAPGEDALPYAEAAVRACELPEDALAFFASAARAAPRNPEAVLARAQKHYHLLARQRHADRVTAAVMTDDEDGIAEADAELKAHKVGSVRWGDGESVLDKRGNAAMFENLPRPLFRLPGEVGRVMSRAFTRDAFAILLGTAKVGKTAHCVRIAYAAAQAGLKVLYVTLGDDKVPRIRRRIMACHAGCAISGEAEEPQLLPIVACKRGARGECRRCQGTAMSPFPDKKVFDETSPEELFAVYRDYKPCKACWKEGKATHPDFDPFVWWIKCDLPTLSPSAADAECDGMASAFRGGDIQVVYRPKGVLAMDGLSDLVDRRADRNGYEDEVVIVDYLEMMKLPPGREDYEQLRTLSEQMRNFTSERNNLVIAPLQGNRLGGVIETHTMESVGRCKWVMDNCTAGFGINQTPRERSMGVVRMNQLAGREFRFSPENQALCCAWLGVQDPYADSFHVYKQIKPVKER